MTVRLRPHVISVRSAHQEGTGDARRVASIAAAFAIGGIDARYSALIGPTESLRELFRGPVGLLRLAGLVPQFLITGRPLQVLMVHMALARRGITCESGELPIYVTSRVVPVNRPHPYVTDFVDSMAENARVSAGDGNWLTRALWRMEARRFERWESAVSRDGALATAVSDEEATTIGPGVETVVIEVDTESGPTARKADRTVLFPGSLFYRPNDEAARWVVSELVPALVAKGWSPSQIVIAGRSPKPGLVELCRGAGATVKANVPDLQDLMRVAGAVVVPLRLGSGVQTKVLHAYACQTPLVMTPRANRGINLSTSDKAGVVVLPRDAASWADAIERVMECPPSADRRAEVLTDYRPARVRQRWLQLLLPLLGGVNE